MAPGILRSVTPRDGMLPRSVQMTLAAMRSNAHRTEMERHGDDITVTFFVYCFETDRDRNQKTPHLTEQIGIC